MKFKVGMRVGLDATIDFYKDILNQGFDYNDYYDNDELPMFGVISFIKDNQTQVIVNWDNDADNISNIANKLREINGCELIDCKYLCTEQQLKDKIKKEKEKNREVEKQLKVLFKEMQETFKKIKKANTTNKELKDFDCAYCLTQFVDQAGWSSSSLDC